MADTRAMRLHRRRGFQTLELMFAVPILAALLMASVVYGKVMVLRSGLAQAATVGAREAGKGASVLEVAGAVNCVLAAYDIAIRDARGSGTKVRVEDGSRVVAEYGDPEVSFASAAPLENGEVRVTVGIRLDAKKIDGTRRVLPFSRVVAIAVNQNQLSTGSLVKSERSVP